jgi:predicted MFS family arabinose efflux permease
MNAVAFSAGMVGAVAATVPLELLLRVWPWRHVFLLIVGLTVIVAFVLWFLVPERRAESRAGTFAQQIAGLGKLLADAAFLRLAICLGASQCAAVALSTLWIATWLRDVAGYAQADVAKGLLAVNVAMVIGYLAFGRAADVLQRRGRGSLPLLMAGVAVSSLCLALLIAGITSLFLWCVFSAAATSVVLGYSLLSRRYPKDMAGRVNTAINLIGFIGMFAGQWGVGLVLDLWPATATGYDPVAYPYALGALWLLQAAGLAWLWLGRHHFR